MTYLSDSDWSCGEGNLLKTNQRHLSDLGGDNSSVWNLCCRFSDVISNFVMIFKIIGINFQKDLNK